MDKEKFYKTNENYLRMVALHYSRRFFVEYDDLFQEGALGILITFNSYGNTKKTDELKKIGRKIANRYMYRYINSEIKRRSLYQ